MLLLRHAIHISWQVVDVPLLFEGGLDRFTSMNITVVSDPDTQRRRLMARDKSERAAADARIAAQVCHVLQQPVGCIQNSVLLQLP